MKIPISPMGRLLTMIFFCENVSVFFLIPGVYFEKVLKSSDTSLWVRNIQMYISGILVTLIGVFVNDGEKVMEKGFFYGYTLWVCFVVCKYKYKPGEVFCFISFPLQVNVIAAYFFQSWPVWAVFTRQWW